MSNTNYTLEIISHHPEFKSKSLRKYYVDGIETIGAWGDEPFEIKFKNNTWQKVQVKLSLDGTDILTGEPANTEVNKDMWVVNGYATLTLKAWPETSNGGSQFVFTTAEKSVAVHTHGDLTSRGIIAAAVFTEGHVEPQRLNPTPHHHYYHPIRRSIYEPYYFGDTFTLGSSSIGGVSFNSSTSNSVIPGAAAAGGSRHRKCVDSRMDSLSLEDSDVSDSISTESRGTLSTLVSVGAGQHVDQKITYVSGLIKPVMAETVRVRYLWWDDLKAKLAEHNVPAPHASGFPGDSKKNIMSIGNTPKVGYTQPAFPRQEAAYSRF